LQLRVRVLSRTNGCRKPAFSSARPCEERGRLRVARVREPMERCTLENQTPPTLSHAHSSHGARQALYGAFSCISLALAYVADRLQPQHRAAAFGYVMASLSIGVLVGPLLGGALAPVRAAQGRTGCVGLLLFGRSAPQRLRQPTLAAAWSASAGRPGAQRHCHQAALRRAGQRQRRGPPRAACHCCRRLLLLAQQCC